MKDVAIIASAIPARYDLNCRWIPTQEGLFPLCVPRQNALKLISDTRGRNDVGKVDSSKLQVEQTTGGIIHHGSTQRVIITTQVDTSSLVANACLPFALIESDATPL